MYVIGEGGEFLYADKGGVREETIDRPGDEPIVRGEIHGMCLLGERIYVVGAAGQAFVRSGPKRWSSWSAGLEDAGEVTLRAVHGLGDDDLHAVGDAGAIWRARGGEWAACDVPAGADLSGVREVEPGLVYAVGAGGTLLRGRDGDWTVVEHGGTDKDLTGVALFKGKLYVSGEEGVFALGDDDGLTRLGVGHGVTNTFRYLHACPDALWSFGERHLFRTEDGESWVDSTPFFSHFDMAESGPVSGPSACGCGGDHTGGGFSCC
jgi:hypothetical protein